MSPRAARWRVDSSAFEGDVLRLETSLRDVHATARFKLEPAGVECIGVTLDGEATPAELVALLDALPTAGLAHARHHVRAQPFGVEGLERDSRLAKLLGDDYRLILVALAWCEPFAADVPAHRRNRRQRVRRALGYSDRDAEAGDMQAWRLVKRARAMGLVPPADADDATLTAAWSRLVERDGVFEYRV
jgi:hypothetical protein